MIIIDRALETRSKNGNPIRVALIGSGFMGKAVANQIMNSSNGIHLVAIGSRTIESANFAWKLSGIDNFRHVNEKGDIKKCVERRIPVSTENCLGLCDIEPIDLILELTGSVRFGSELAIKCIQSGKDFLTMNAELDATVGTMLKHLAEKAGVIYSLSDGDQPGVQMNLWRFARTIGLQPLVCGNIKGLHDPYRNPTTQEAFAKKWQQNPYMVTSFADGTKISFEQACVANATGMSIEERGMRGGTFTGHVDELCINNRYNIDQLIRLHGVVDYTVESKPGPGIFVLATTSDTSNKRMLDLYKLGKGPLYCLYTPYHLCHFEIPISIARVVIMRDTILASSRPSVEVITMAKKNLESGAIIDAIGGFMTYGLCERYSESMKESLLPMGLAEGCRLNRSVGKDSPITYADVEFPDNHILYRLRSQQDRMWPD